MSLPGSNPVRHEIKALTGLRGVAALIVMAYHYWSPSWVHLTTVGGHIVARGYISVDVFFILSGFVMSKAYGRRFVGRFSTASYLRFLGRRLGRIYPIYAVLTMVGVVASAVRPAYFPPLTVSNVMLNLALVQVWFGHLSIIGTAWSLSTEWAAYLAFPPLVWLVLRGRPSTAIATCAVAASVIVLLWGYEVSLGRSAALALDEAGNFVTPFGRCFGGFIIGMGLFRVAGSPAAAFIGTDACGAAAAAVILAAWLSPAMPDLLLYACLPLLILCLALNTGRFGAAFSCKPIWLLGEWSYSIYLAHGFMIHGRQRMFDRLVEYLPSPLADTVDVVIFYGLTIGVAAICFSLIEMPARRFIAGCLGSTPDRSAPSVAGVASLPQQAVEVPS